jgi:hypothetical protein
MLSIVLMIAVGGFYSMVTGSALAQSASTDREVRLVSSR